jgi:hypothetical protein
LNYLSLIESTIVGAPTLRLNMLDCHELTGQTWPFLENTTTTRWIVDDCSEIEKLPSVLASELIVRGWCDAIVEWAGIETVKELTLRTRVYSDVWNRLLTRAGLLEKLELCMASETMLTLRHLKNLTDCVLTSCRELRVWMPANLMRLELLACSDVVVCDVPSDMVCLRVIAPDETTRLVPPAQRCHCFVSTNNGETRWSQFVELETVRRIENQSQYEFIEDVMRCRALETFICHCLRWYEKDFDLTVYAKTVDIDVCVDWFLWENTKSLTLRLPCATSLSINGAWVQTRIIAPLLTDMTAGSSLLWTHVRAPRLKKFMNRCNHGPLAPTNIHGLKRLELESMMHAKFPSTMYSCYSPKIVAPSIHVLNDILKLHSDPIVWVKELELTAWYLNNMKSMDRLSHCLEHLTLDIRDVPVTSKFMFQTTFRRMTVLRISASLEWNDYIQIPRFFPNLTTLVICYDVHHPEILTVLEQLPHLQHCVINVSRKMYDDQRYARRIALLFHRIPHLHIRAK